MTNVRKIITLGFAALIFLAASSSTLADGHGSSWNLIIDDSRVSFGSVKADSVGESHLFTSISGDVNDEGLATIKIDLLSVDTGIGIRNDRMKQHVFGAIGPSSTLTATIDPKVINDLAPGSTSYVDVAGNLSFGEETIDINAKMFVAKLSDKKVMVTTDGMIMVGTETLGITTGIDKLVELAKLPSIGRVAPVTLRFVFEKAS